jgi:hypothetical protein
MSSKPVKAEVDVMWIATKAADHSIRIITRQTFPVEIGKAMTAQVPAESPETSSTWLHLEYLGENWMSGAKMGGWIVVVRSGPAVLSYKASAVAGSDLMREPEKMAKLLAAIPAEP